MVQKRQRKNADHLEGLLANIFGSSIITVPKRFKLPSEYQKIGLQAIIKAWDIGVKSNDDGTYKLHLPKGWVMDYPEQPLRVKDSKGAIRMSLATSSTFIQSPIRTKMNCDESAEWIEVLHGDEEVFRSNTFNHDKLPLSPDMYEVLKELVPPENPAWDKYQAPVIPNSVEEREEANYQAYLAVKPYWDEAEAYVQKHYPLLDKDPNAYW